MIDHKTGGKRLIAEIYPRSGGGIVFFDIGWLGSSSHAIHDVEGELREAGEGRWTIGEHEIYEIGEDDKHNLYRWKKWMEIRKSIKQEDVDKIAKRYGAIV